MPIKHKSRYTILSLKTKLINFKITELEKIYSLAILE
jgi:hypothetical protein